MPRDQPISRQYSSFTTASIAAPHPHSQSPKRVNPERNEKTAEAWDCSGHYWVHDLSQTRAAYRLIFRRTKPTSPRNPVPINARVPGSGVFGSNPVVPGIDVSEISTKRCEFELVGVKKTLSGW